MQNKKNIKTLNLCGTYQIKNYLGYEIVTRREKASINLLDQG